MAEPTDDKNSEHGARGYAAGSLGAPEVPASPFVTGTDDASNQVVIRQREAAGRRFIDIINSEPSAGINHLRHLGFGFEAAPIAASPVPAAASLALSGTPPDTEATEAAAIVERRLSERPTDIREAARALSQAIKDQIEQLYASKPNDDPVGRLDSFIDFLQEIARGLDDLAESIEQAIAAGSSGSSESILLGKSANLARKLGVFVTEGLERNRAYIQDCAIRFSVFATGYMFLHACGVDGLIASIVAGNLSKGGESKK